MFFRLWGSRLCYVWPRVRNRLPPDAAKRFLKLLRYEVDEESFSKAADAGDVLAVNGFISGGMNVNARNAEGDTALAGSNRQ